MVIQDMRINKTDDIDIILEDLDPDDIDSILTKWSEVDTLTKHLNTLQEMLKMKVKAYLKERKWDRYFNKKSKISVTLATQKREVIDKGQVKLILSNAQFAQVLRTTTFEKLSIVTPETRRRLKDYVVPKKR